MLWSKGRLPNPGTVLVPSHSYARRMLLIFALVYFFLILFTRWHTFRDPTSVFFDPSTGYLPAYSTVRFQQSDRYIEDANQGVAYTQWRASESPRMCLGVASVARKGARYFRSAVGSILEGLNEAERANMHLILFIAHTNASEHPAYSEPWLHNVADQVLLYNETEVDIDHIHDLETDSAKFFAREKALFDYTYLLKACQAANTSFVAMVEDDVLALDGWFHRTLFAVDEADQMTLDKGASNWLYLRLFYTEQLLGWNSEEWPAYLFGSVVTVGIVGCALLGMRRYQPKIRPMLPDNTILLLSFVCTPLLIGLYFAAGRVTMRPILPGVHEMPRFGCCSQGFVFPQSRVPDLIQLYEEKKAGYVDMLTEDFANANDEIRYAITPSVLQHVGRRSSKEADWNSTKPKQGITDLWNFAYELNDPTSLSQEHDAFREPL
ncbi:uncharacterized protein KD926_002755 [Aspergillus affinis]|uniref:uncharacterized protein n=1 Tax=Aspergillus affinis TaxID=1070780 RepID=UPI0022FE3B83|nr:uncharacterized protein KD926_002755 [Aspergillus affinis]KAI9043864.1 hypothetical protein KD926_002755 [Aspergillus affinis]